MNRIDAMLQPGETVVSRNRPGLGSGTSLLIGLALVVVFGAVMVWLGGGWESLWREPYRLLPLAAIPLLGRGVLQDVVVVTDRRLLITRGPLRRTIAEVGRADILSATVIKSVPYFAKVVAVRCRERGAVRLHRPDTADTVAFDHEEIGTLLTKGADEMCRALEPPRRSVDEESVS